MTPAAALAAVLKEKSLAEILDFMKDMYSIYILRLPYLKN